MVKVLSDIIFFGCFVRQFLNDFQMVYNAYINHEFEVESLFLGIYFHFEYFWQGFEVTFLYSLNPQVHSKKGLFFKLFYVIQKSINMNNKVFSFRFVFEELLKSREFR